MGNRELIEAVKSGNLAEVESVLGNDSSLINGKDENRMTPLHWAAKNGHIGIVRFLLANGAVRCLHDKDDCGLTALEYADAIGHENVVEFLRQDVSPGG